MQPFNNLKEQRGNLSQIAEQFVLDSIRYEHPDWVNKNGECPKCDEYYEALSEIVTIDEISP